MAHPDPNFARDLARFADGELSAPDCQHVQEQLSNDPAARVLLQSHQQLTASARRVVLERTPPPSERLRARLRGLVPEVPDPTAVRANRLPWTGWAAAAAMVLIAFLAGIWSARRPAVSLGPLPGVDVIPVETVAHAEEIHGFCSRLALGLHSGGYPADVAALAPQVERDLHSEHPYPDLSSMGYRYRGAGPCGQPLPDAAHLLYQSVRPGSVNAVSVFVQPWHQQYPLDDGRVYTVSVTSSPFPMLAWRSEHVVYFLIADDAATEQEALTLVRGGATTQPP